jgi:hypothetical protein
MYQFEHGWRQKGHAQLKRAVAEADGSQESSYGVRRYGTSEGGHDFILLRID